jgi:outer membrane lipoprotein-sorting protein
MHQRRKAVLSVAVVLLVAIGLFLSLRAWHANKPEQIIKRMVQAYKDCGSYKDAGNVKMRLGDRPIEGSFTTVYVKPDRFRFEFNGKMDEHLTRFIIWKKGADMNAWYNRMPKSGLNASWNIAMAAAGGVTGSSASTVAILLLPHEFDAGVFNVAKMTAMKRLSDENVGDSPCFQIKGKLEGEDITIWLDKGTFLLRRVDTRNGTMWESKTLYQTGINDKIEEASLAFNAPAS